VINKTEAETVRHIFRSYLELGCVRLLEQRLRDEGVRSKVHRKAEDASRDGKPIVRGALYLIIRNRLYRGEISHKGAVYPGEHLAVIDRALWDAVQKQLVEHRATSANRANATVPSLLTGLVYDETGDRMVPSHAMVLVNIQGDAEFGTNRHGQATHGQASVAARRHKCHPCRSGGPVI
jgi:site-specific DNA recombinase